MQTKPRKSKIERKLDLIFETLLQICEKIMDQQQIDELNASLMAINAEHLAKKIDEV